MLRRRSEGSFFLLDAMGRWRSLRAIVWMQWAAGAAILKNRYKVRLNPFK